MKVKADFICFFGEFYAGALLSDLGVQNAEIDSYNRTFSDNGWTGSFERIGNLGALGINLCVIFDAGMLGDIGFYAKYDNIQMNSHAEDIGLNVQEVEEVFYPTGEMAATGEYHFVLQHASLGFRKYWLGPWESVFFNFFTGMDIGWVFGFDDMVDIRRFIYNKDGSVLQDGSKKMKGGFLGVCLETGFLIPSNFGFGFDLKAGYMAAMGIVTGTGFEVLDISGFYFKLGIAVDFVEDYKRLIKKKDIRSQDSRQK